jgi:hypothetical protein
MLTNIQIICSFFFDDERIIFIIVNIIFDAQQWEKINLLKAKWWNNSTLWNSINSGDSTEIKWFNDSNA